MDEADLLNGLSSEISEFVIALLSAEENSGIFCPQPNIETVSIAAMKAGSTPIVVGTTPPVLAALFACITNAQFKFLETDPYQRDLFTDHADFKRDFALVVPPFGLRTEGGNLTSHVPSDFGARSSDVLGVELALRCTQEKAVVVVPNSLLFKGGAERRLREHLVERGLLEAVISFPSGLLANTNLPFSILVISKKRRKANNVRFCRVSERDHVTGQGKLRTHNRRFIGGAAILAALKSLKSRDCVSVGANDIQSQEYTLVPDRFFGNSSGMLKSRKNQTLALGEIVMIVKPQLLPESQEGSGVEVGEISPGEMPAYGYLEQSPRIRHVDEKLLRLRQSQIVYAGDVLLSTKGTIGKVALCRPTPGARPLLPSLASVILRFNPRQTSIDPRFLVMYLRSPAVQRVLDTMAVGVTVRNISLADLRGMAVWVPSLAEQNKLIQVIDRQMELENQVHQIVIEQDAISARLWQEIGLDQSDQEAA
jgi:type I restriction enzyme M protein